MKKAITENFVKIKNYTLSEKRDLNPKKTDVCHNKRCQGAPIMTMSTCITSR